MQELKLGNGEVPTTRMNPGTNVVYVALVQDLKGSQKLVYYTS